MGRAVSLNHAPHVCQRCRECTARAVPGAAPPSYSSRPPGGAIRKRSTSRGCAFGFESKELMTRDTCTAGMIVAQSTMAIREINDRLEELAPDPLVPTPAPISPRSQLTARCTGDLRVSPKAESLGA